ncbi:MAG: phytanoyl-CoA dioxygenase, partial [Bacteroidota bacterium]
MSRSEKTTGTKVVPDNQHLDIPGNPSTAKSSTVRLREQASTDSLRVLTMEQWAFWMENGYVVVKQAVPREQAAQTAAFLWEFEDKDSQNPSTWYTAARAEMQMKELAGTGMVEV